MAHAYSRGGRRDEPDPRDLIEHAARAAGMSVEQWLDRALADKREDASHRGRQAKRRRRTGRDQDEGGVASSFNRRGVGWRPLRNNEFADDRVGRIIDDAMETMHERLRANEEHTASALSSLRRRLEHGLPPPPQRNRVRDLLSDIEHDFRHQDTTPLLSGQSSLVQQLEERIARAVSQIEKRARVQEQPAAEAEPRDLRQGTRNLKRQVEMLTARLDALSQRDSVQASPGMPQASVDVVQRLHDEVARLVRSSPPQSDQLEILRVLQSVDAKVSQLEKTSSAQVPFDLLIKEVASLRAGLRDNPGASGIDQTRFDQQFDALAVRLDAIADKVAMLRLAGPKDNPGSQSIELAIDQLKHLIEASQAPADDSRVLNALRSVEQRLETFKLLPDALTTKLSRFDSLEQKLDAIQRAPADISQRLDQIQSLVADRSDVATEPMSSNVKALLRSLAARLETMQSAPVDERALQRLQKDIRALSSKLDLNASSQPMQPSTDIRGLEQSVSDLLQRVDGLKIDLSATAEQAMRRAASDVLGQASDRGSASPAGATVQVQHKLSEIHAAQQDAERRTSETLGAVHETLKWVVDRVVDMEREMKQQGEIALQPPKPAAPPLPPEEPVSRGSAAHPQAIMAGAAANPPRPTAANPLPSVGATLQVQPPQAAGQTSGSGTAPMAGPGTLSPDASAIARIAAMRAQRIGISVPMAQVAESPKSAIAAAFAAAREAVARHKTDKGKASKPTASTAEGSSPKPEGLVQAPPARKADASTDLSASLDLPLEPGSGRPKPRAEPAASDLDPKDPKAQFIAAARRAAQTAVEQSGEVLDRAAVDAKPAKPAKPGKEGKPSLQKKHALLLGLAALIVAVGATLQFMREPQKPATEIEPPRQSSSSIPLQPERPQVAEAPTRALQVTPRQILPPSTDPLPPSLTRGKPDDRVINQPPASAQPATALQLPDPAVVGSIAQDAPRPQPVPPGTPRAAPPVSSDPLMQFDGITGSERLKNAARAGDPSAFIELGTRYLEGRGAPRDLKAAALWFERAADAGSAPAQYRLGAMYREGRGVERNALMAMKHFQAAAEAGNARAMHNAAVLLAEGVNGSPDYAGAGEWFKKASEFGIRDSQYNLAILYARGLGVGQDLMASYAWFAAAAASGDEDAAKKRDEVGARLSADKLQQAKAAAQAWKPKTPDPAANEVAVPAGGWDSTAKQVPAAALSGTKPKPNRS